VFRDTIPVSQISPQSVAFSVFLHAAVFSCLFVPNDPPHPALPPIRQSVQAEPVPELNFPPLVLTRVPSRKHQPQPEQQPSPQASQQPSPQASQQQSLQLKPPPPGRTLGGTAW
jgi:hypothetical protein